MGGVSEDLFFVLIKMVKGILFISVYPGGFIFVFDIIILEIWLFSFYYLKF